MYLNKSRYGKKNQFGPRVRFNHGYHDAVFDVRNKGARELHPTLHDSQHVSPAFDVMYFEGYKAGITAVCSGDYNGNSEADWLKFRITLNEEQLQEVYEAEISADMYGCDKKYIQYRLPEAEKRAREVCGL